MNGKYILLVFVVIILSGIASAKSSDLFIDHISSIIYVDCQGENLTIKEPFIENSITKETITQIPWPYNYETLRKIIELFGEMEPWDFFQGTCNNRGVSIGGSKDACGILKCGDNQLDINQYNYFWNDERVDVPKETTNIAINNQGNLAQGLSNCNIQQEQYKNELSNCTLQLTTIQSHFDNATLVIQESKKDTFWLKYIYPFIISLILSLTSYLMINPASKKKKNIKTLLLYLFIFLVISYLISYILMRIV